MKKIPILLIVNDRPYLLPIVLNRIIKFTNWDKFELWILENYASDSVKKIIAAYKTKYSFINIYFQEINQISQIQNSIISKLKRDLYIKLDDDIFVTKNWTNGFVNIIERNNYDISIGSVVIPVNGFGWKIFLEKMDLVSEFYKKFPDLSIIQGCMETAVWKNPKVAQFMWEHSLPLDTIANKFINSQNEKFEDYEVQYRYSIGAITFTHDFWKKMGGWKIDENFFKKEKAFNFLNFVNNKIAKLRNREKQNRIRKIIEIVTTMNKSTLGMEEEYLFKFSQENNLKQYATTESIVFHFSYYPTELSIIKSFLLKIYEDQKI